MQLELSEQQFRAILEAVVIGVRVREYVHEQRETPDWDRIGDIETYLLSAAEGFGAGDMAELYEGTMIPSDALSEAMDEELDEYEDLAFWERLRTDLGQRDFRRTVTKQDERFMKKNGGLFPPRITGIYESYRAEFEEHDIDRLQIVKGAEAEEETLRLRLGKRQYEVLQGVLMLEPEHEKMIENAQPEGAGFILSGPWEDFDSLADCVAGEANHTQSTKKGSVLDAIYGKIEKTLGH